MRRARIALLGGLVLMALVACGQPAVNGTDSVTAGTGTSSSGSPAPVTTGSDAAPQGGALAEDQASLIAQLRGLGFTVTEAGTIEQPFLQTGGTTLRITGGTLQQAADVQVFSYADAQTAANDAQQIGPDGNPRTTMISWVGAPHFFRNGQLIALYVGDDQAVVNELTTVLGPQFAGR